MRDKEIEREKAFIRDTIESVGLSRTEIVVSLARTKHLDKAVFKGLGALGAEVSGPVLDFVANLPVEQQRLIIRRRGEAVRDIRAVIADLTGEIISDDAVFTSDLMKAWRHATPEARKRFLAFLESEK